MLLTWKNNLSYHDGKYLRDDEVPRSKAGVKVSRVNNDYIIGGREKSNGRVDRNIDAKIDHVVIKSTID